MKSHDVFSTGTEQRKAFFHQRRVCFVADSEMLCYLEEKLSPFLHYLLDLEEAGGVHEQKLVSHVHAEPARVAKGQDLLEALRLHGWRQLHHRALTAGVEQVPEVGAAGC